MTMMMIVIADFLRIHDVHMCTWPLFFRNVIQFPIRSKDDGFICELLNLDVYLMVFDEIKKKTVRTTAKTKHNTNCKRFNLKQWISPEVSFFLLLMPNIAAKSKEEKKKQNAHRPVKLMVWFEPIFLSLTIFSERSQIDEIHHETVGNYEMEILFSDSTFVLFCYECWEQKLKQTQACKHYNVICFDGYVHKMSARVYVCVCVFACKSKTL